MVERIEPSSQEQQQIASEKTPQEQGRQGGTTTLTKVSDDTSAEDRKVVVANAAASLRAGIAEAMRPLQPNAPTDPSKQAIVDDGESFIFDALSDETLAAIERRTALFDELAKDFSCSVGKSESRRERSERGLTEINLTYGEIEFKSFFQVFKWIQKTYKDEDPDCWHNAFNNPGGTFIDLGHGTGKGILAGAMMHQFERCWGIEILESLQNVSIQLKGVYDTYVADVDPVEYEGIFGWPVASAPRFDVVLGDIMAIEWHDADMIFCNSTCFSAPMMQTIYEKTLKCKKGTWFVTMSKRLPHTEKAENGQPMSPDAQWEFILAIKLVMSWGKATVNVQRKITHPS